MSVQTTMTAGQVRAETAPFTVPLFVRHGRALDRGGRVHRLVGYYPANHPAYRIVTVCELRVCVLDDTGHVLTSRRECDGDLTHVITTPETQAS